MEKIYFKIKYIILEYEDILKLDKEYMSIFLKECKLNINENEYKENKELINEKDEKIIYKQVGDKDCKKMYKKLAKKLHPDKNPKKTEEFIEIKKKEEEIKKIKEQIHWKWIECENDLEKELLKQYVNNY